MPDRTGSTRQKRRALLTCCLALALAACQSPTTPIDSHALALAADDIASLAAEAALLTEQLAARSVTDNYAWVHQDALAQASVELAGRIARPVPPAAQARHQQLLELHARLDTALERIVFAAHEPVVLEQLHGRFGQIRAQAVPLGERP